MKKILYTLAATVALVTFMAGSASAADVDININAGAQDVLQLNLGGVAAIDKITIDQTNAANVANVVGDKVNDMNVSQAAANIAQGNLAGAIAYDPASTVDAVQTNALNVLSATLDTKDWSDLNVAQSASSVIQGNLGLAAGNIVDLSQVNAANVIDLSVNVDN